MSDSFRRGDGVLPEWRVERELVAYEDALRTMEARVAAIRDGSAAELVWLVEHPPLYTAGTSAGSVLPLTALPLYRTGRGGQITYHGPGQRVVYLMLDLEERGRDIRALVACLEGWLIAALSRFGIQGCRREGRVGVWVSRPDKPRGLGTDTPEASDRERPIAEDKIAALGIRIRRWVSFHGVSLNVAPELAHYRDIVPCGISDAHLGVTSLADLGVSASLADVDEALLAAFRPIFGEVGRVPPI